MNTGSAPHVLLNQPCGAGFPTLTLLATRCPLAPVPQQPWLCGPWPRQWQKAPHLEGSCPWVNTLLSSSWNSSSFMNKRLHIFSLLLGPADDAVNPVLQEGLARFYSKKKKKKASGLSAPCNTFSGFSETISSFRFSVIPLGLAAGCMSAALLNLWCSFPAHLQCFHNSRMRCFTTWP